MRSYETSTTFAVFPVLCRVVFLLTVFSLLHLCNPHQLIAQKNFIPGYIITTEGDTLRGLIDDRDWDKSPKEVSFKPTKQKQEVTYSPKEIRAFQGEAFYESAAVNREISPAQLAKLDRSSALKIIKDTVFLKLLLGGEFSLYQHTAKGSKLNFYIKKEGAFLHLAHKKFLFTENLRTETRKNRDYIRVLSQLLEDCPDLESSVLKVEFTPNSLRKLLQKYYACTGKSVNYIQKKRGNSFQFGLIAGISNTALSFNSKNFEYLTAVDYPSSTDLSIGMFFSVKLPYQNGKWGFVGEINYGSFSAEGFFSDFENENIFTNTSTELGASHLTLNASLRYHFSIASLPTYFDLGISNGLAFDITNNSTELRKFFTTEETKQGPAIEKIRKYEQGLTFGLGSMIDRYGVELRYKRSNGISAFTSLTSPIDQWLGRVFYLF